MWNIILHKRYVGTKRGRRIRFPTRAESAKQAGLFLTVEALDCQAYFRPRQKVRRGRYG
ncbi:MAG: hypothetical protein LBV50_03420 [Novosphingobium sp.]|jgi:hypothetical protein|nr:hypothetical protein [Novosphingobium sp.]